MNQERRQAYEWAKNQDYQSVAARYAKILAVLIDEMNPPSGALTMEKLRAEMKQERAHRLHAEQHADAFLEDCKRLNAELENYRKGHCSEGGCAAEKDRDAVLAELEQAKLRREQE